MNFKYLKKQGLSIIIVLTMIVSLMPFQVMASDWTDDEYDLTNTEIFTSALSSEDELPEMKLVAVKANEGENGYDIYTPSDLGIDDTIIVAVQANNFDAYKYASKGVNGISTGIVYDTNYLQPTNTSNSNYRKRVTALFAADESSYITQAEAALDDEELFCEYSMDSTSSLPSVTMSEGETSTLSNDNDDLKKSTLYMSAAAGDDDDDDEQLQTIDDGSFIAFAEFKVIALPEEGSSSAGVSLSRSESIVVVLTEKGDFNKTYTATDGLHKYMKLTDSVNLFPAATTYTSFTKDTDTGCTLATQYVGSALNTSGLNFLANDGSEDTKVAGNATGVTYYYADSSGETSTTNLTEVLDTLTAELDGKYLYAVYSGLVCEVGQMTVNTDTISKIELDSGVSTAFTGTYYTGASVATTLGTTPLVDLTYASTATKTDVAYSDLADAGLVLYVADALGNLTAVTADTTLATGTNTFYVAPSGETTVSGLTADKYATFTITGTATTISALTATGSIEAVSYGTALTLDNVKVSVTNENGEKDYTGLSAINAAGVDLYATTSANETGTKLEESTVLPAGTYSVYAVAGSVKSSGVTATVNQLTITLDGAYPSTATTKEYDATTAATPATAEPSISNAVSGDTVSVKATYTFADANVGEDKNVSIAYALEGADAANYALPASDSNFTSSAKGTITAKTITLPTDYNVPAITKNATTLTGTGSVTLTSTEGVPTDETETITLSYSYEYANSTSDTPTVTLTNLSLSSSNYALPTYSNPLTTTGSTATVSSVAVTTNLVTSDLTYGETVADLAAESDAAVITITYSNSTTKDVTLADAIAAGYVTIDGTAATADTVLPVSGTLKFTVDGVSSSDIAISVSPKEVELVLTGLEASGTITKTYNGDTNLPSDITISGLAAAAGSLVGDDTLPDVTGVTYEYKSAGAADSIVITASGTPSTADNTFNSKYTLKLPSDTSTNLTGAITKAKLTVKTITVDPIAANATTLTGSDSLVLNTENSDIVDGDTVTLTYDYEYSTSDPNAETVTVTITNPTLTGDDAANYELDTTSIIAEGSVSSKQLSKITSVDAGAVYNSNGTVDISNLVIEVEYTDGETETFNSLAEILADGYAVTITDKDGQTVTLGEDGTFTANAGSTYTINIAKDGSADDGTAVTVDVDVEVKLPVTPAAPTATVDQSTNAITVSAPVDTDGNTLDVSAVEYVVVKTGESIPDDAVWTTFESADDIALTTDADGNALENGTAYTVYVRVAATDDTIASSTVASASVTTYKYQVTVMKASTTTEKIIDTAYVNDITVESYSDFKSKTGIKISTSSYTTTLYEDAKASTKVAYPYTISDDVTLYVKASTGGGGGSSSGGSSSSGVTITLDTTAITGEAGETYTVTATVSGSSTSPTWTSSDETVATVDSNGNITLVGDGTATITATVGSASKSVTVTVGETEATPEPTDDNTDNTPLISKDYAKAYANGYEDGSFRPDASLTRAELASMIARLINGGDIADGTYYASFPDVDADAWYSKYIGYLEGFGILTGYEDGNFLPNDVVTRSEMCAVVARAQKLGLVSYSGEYSDVTDDDWAKDYIATLAENGIIEGYDGNEFRPYALLTRAEAVTIINRLLDSTTVEDEVSFNDISGHWAENAIILAASDRIVETVETVVDEDTVEDTAVDEDTADEETVEETADEETEEETADEEATDEETAEETTEDDSSEETEAE